jgi:L-asparaginase II
VRRNAEGEPEAVQVESSFKVEASRGAVVESSHEIHAVVADRSGALQVWGDGDRQTIARSAIKSVQALPLVTTGAADAFDLSQQELALACASHSAESPHVETVLGWLGRLGLTEHDLECGGDRPLGKEVRREFYARRDEQRPVYNGCSGKHAGFLTVSRHLGHPIGGYISPLSPVQRLVTSAIETMTGFDLSDQAPGIDGCGIPVWAIPLRRLAFAMARMVDPTHLGAELAAACTRMVDAARQAFWVSGTGRTEMVVEKHALEPILIKGGAEGVFMVGLPDRGVGIALKAADGPSRAARVAIAGLLRWLDVLPPDRPEVPVLVRNKAGNIAGELRPVLSSPDRARLPLAG